SETMIYGPKKDTAGTIDFLAITKDGKVSILDWKFMDISTDYYTDVPWYKKILTEAYGIPYNSFGTTRAIPIRTIYKMKKKEGTKDKYPVLSTVEIGEVKVSAEKYDYLLPVSLETESTGDSKLDAILRKLT